MEWQGVQRKNGRKFSQHNYIIPGIHIKWLKKTTKEDKCR